MTANFGIGMFFYGMTCTFINKSTEEIEQEENEKYLKELKGKL
jgi:hypothetical protein